LSTSPESDRRPVWSPAGDEVAFTSDRAGIGDILLGQADGSGEEKVLAATPQRELLSDWSRDGKYLLYYLANPVVHSKQQTSRRYKVETLGVMGSVVDGSGRCSVSTSLASSIKRIVLACLLIYSVLRCVPCCTVAAVILDGFPVTPCSSNSRFSMDAFHSAQIRDASGATLAGAKRFPDGYAQPPPPRSSALSRNTLISAGTALQSFICALASGESQKRLAELTDSQSAIT